MYDTQLSGGIIPKCWLLQWEEQHWQQFFGMRVCVLKPFRMLKSVDEGQITHLICARLEYDLYDFFGGVFLGLFYKKRTGSRPKTPPKKVM